MTCTSCTNFESQQSTHAYHMQQVLAVVVSLNDTPSLPKKEKSRYSNKTPFEANDAYILEYFQIDIRIRYLPDYSWI